MLAFTVLLFSCQEDEVAFKSVTDSSRYAELYEVPFYQENDIKEFEDIKFTEYNWLRMPPRPLPCPGPILTNNRCEPEPGILLAKLPEGAKFISLEAFILTEKEEIFACSSEKCEGKVDYKASEAYAVLNVVSPELHEQPLFLVLEVSFYLEGEVMTEKMYDKFTFEE